jgi:transcriptional repressor NrdR
MNCPYCNHIETKVTDSRDTGGSIRRRRECLSCNKRFTTYEYIETVNKAKGMLRAIALARTLED